MVQFTRQRVTIVAAVTSTANLVFVFSLCNAATAERKKLSDLPY